MRRSAVVAFCFLGLILACSPSQNRVVVAAGTTLVDSGFIEGVIAVFEEEDPGIEVSVVAQPTKLALELGREGAADLVLTHAPVQEAEFVASGHALRSEPVVESEFLVLGPEGEAPPPGLSAVEIFGMVADRGIPFVSRGDGSGTHDAELGIWAKVGVDPRGADWYLETGQGMGATLLVGDQREAVVLSELGAYVGARNEVALVDYRASPAGLENVYSAHVAASGANRDGAEQLLSWLQSDRGTEAIERVNLSLFGEILYSAVSD